MRKSYFFKQRLFAAILLLIGCVSASYADDITINPSTRYRGNCVCAFNGSIEDTYSTYQYIYTASEMGGKAGYISTLSYLVDEIGSSTFRPSLKVYMGLTSKDKFDSRTDAFTSTELTLVYDGTPLLGSVATDQWESLKLDKSFYYNGSDNMVVVICTSGISDITELTSSSYAIYYPSDVDRALGRSATEESSKYLEYNDVNVLSHYTLCDYLPCVKFGLGESTGVTEITVGTGTNMVSLAPFDCGSKYSITQSLYTMSELGAKGTITSISYEVGTASAYKMEDLKIYMGHKGSTFSSDPLAVSDLTLVYSGTDVTMGNTAGWETIKLDKAFTYNGSQNLVVVVCKKSQTTNSTLKYKYTGMSSGSYGLYREGDASAVSDISNTQYGYTSFVQRPNVKFTKGDVSDNADTDISSLKNAIYSTSLNSFKGKQLIVPIQMKNTTVSNITAVQFDMTLPDGFTVAEEVEGDDTFYLVDLVEDRTSSSKHTITASYQENGLFRVVCSSSSKAVFSGDDGVILNVVLDVDSDVSPGDYKLVLSNVIASDTESTRNVFPEFVSTITVNDYVLGDSNVDGDVDISDYVAAINYIVHPTTSTASVKAMDTNCDGDIDVSDAVGILNIIKNVK